MTVSIDAEVVGRHLLATCLFDRAACLQKQKKVMERVDTIKDKLEDAQRNVTETWNQFGLLESEQLKQRSQGSYTRHLWDIFCT